MIEKKDKTQYLLVLILLSAFLILKVLRGFVGAGAVSSMEQGGIWNVIQLVFVFLGIIILFSKETTYWKIPSIKIYCVFMFYVWFLGLFPFLYKGRFDIYALHRFFTIPYGVMVLLLFYYFGKRVLINQYRIVLFVVFYIISIVMINALRNYWIDILDESGAVADVYYAIGLLPIIFANSTKRTQIIPFLTVCGLIMMSGKRAGFVILAAILIVYFLRNSPDQKNKISNINLFGFALITIIVFVLITTLSTRYNLNMFTKLERLESDGGSGRLKRWQFISNDLLNNSSILQLLFGHGYGKTVSLVGGHAHNDFLEFLYDYGLFAGIMYVMVFIGFFKESGKMFRHHYHYAREFLCSCIISLGMALFSFYAIDCTHITSSSVCLGLFLSDWQKFKENGYVRTEEQ